MKSSIKAELFIINGVTLALIGVLNLSSVHIAQPILGIPFLIFLPGYTFVTALFPGKKDLDSVARIALSFGISFAVVSLIGLALNYTTWGVTLDSTLFSVAPFIITASVISYFRRRKLTEDDQFSIPFPTKLRDPGSSIWNKTISVILIVSIAGALGTLGYTTANPRIGERFTEFYILGPNGRAQGYPKELTVGDEGKVIIGIINHEQETITYRVAITIDGQENNGVGPLTLENGEKWEEEVFFIPTLTGQDQKVEFNLFRLDLEGAYRSLHLWIDVTQ